MFAVSLSSCSPSEEQPKFRDAEDFARSLVEQERCAIIAAEAQRLGKEALTTTDKTRVPLLIDRSKQLVDQLESSC